jgi:radical SAM protein with 4Fe4S-binding SPASM domain
LSEDIYKRQDGTKISTLISAKGDPHEVIASVIGQPFRDYRKKWEDAIAFKVEPEGPIHIDLELCFNCNLKCTMCFFSQSAEEIAKWGDRSKKISMEQAKKILDEAKASGAVSVGLNVNNEPLLTRWLPELIKYARDIGYLDVMFNTNGYLLDEKVSKALVESGLTRIMISLDAMTEDVYQQIRVGSDFNRVVSNIEGLLRQREELSSLLPLVRVSFVKMSINEHQLDKFVEHWSQKVDFVSIQEYENYFSGEDKETKEALKADGAREQVDEFVCGQPWARAVIRHDGIVLPCCSAHGNDLPMGNIFETKLQDIWNSKNWKKLRIMHQEKRYYDHPVCKDCASSFVK